MIFLNSSYLLFCFNLFLQLPCHTQRNFPLLKSICLSIHASSVQTRRDHAEHRINSYQVNYPNIFLKHLFCKEAILIEGRNFKTNKNRNEDHWKENNNELRQRYIKPSFMPSQFRLYRERIPIIWKHLKQTEQQIGTI